MREIREALYDWMAAVLRERGWTAAEWARRARVTPTNVTRFLRSPDTASLPGAETLGRLAWAAGREPRFLPDRRQQAAADVWRVPVLATDEARALLALGRAEAERFLRDRLLREGAAGCLLLDRPPSARAFALRIGSPHMNAGGVLPGDAVVVEPVDVRPPQTGDLVVVVRDGAACGYRFYPPHLVPVSTDPASVPIPCDGATVLGVGLQLVRPLRR